MKIKFWTYHKKGFVKLKLSIYKPITISESRWNGEGTSWGHDKYEFDADTETVRNEWIRGGNDCDGSFREGGVLTCDINRLKVRPGYSDKNILLPDWKKEESYQRDFRAESMNY